MFLIPICAILFLSGGWETIIFVPIGGAIFIVTTIIMAYYLKKKNASSGTILTTASVIFFSFLSIRINLAVATDGPTLYWLGSFISGITNRRINVLINESSLFSVLQYLSLLSLIILIIILIFICIKVKENENGELSKNQHAIFNIIPILIVLIHIIILIPNMTIAFCGNNYISPRNNACPLYASGLQSAVYTKYSK